MDSGLVVCDKCNGFGRVFRLDAAGNDKIELCPKCSATGCRDIYYQPPKPPEPTAKPKNRLHEFLMDNFLPYTLTVQVLGLE